MYKNTQEKKLMKFQSNKNFKKNGMTTTNAIRYLKLSYREFYELAESNNIIPAKIGQSLEGKNYKLWKNEDITKLKIILTGSPVEPSKPVERIDPISGYCFEYESINKATYDGFIRNAIVKCCDDLQMEHKGYFWRYL